MRIFTLLMVLSTLFSTIQLNAQGRNSILFISNEDLADSDGNTYLDQPIIDELSVDYDVTVTYTPFDYDDMNNYGMIFIGRAANSADFTDFVAWSDIEVPILICSVWLMRNNRLMFFNSTDAKKVAEDGTAYEGAVTSVMVMDETDPAFEGVTMTDGIFDWYNGFYDYFLINHETFSDVNNGTPLAFIYNDDITPATAGNVVMARWEDGIETYDGSGNIPAAWRSFVQFGADDNLPTATRHYNYSNFTDASLQVILNEVKYLLSKSINAVATEIDNESIGNNQIRVYHSFSNSKELVLDLSGYKATEQLNVTVVDISGREVFRQLFSSDNTKNTIHPVLRSGVYIVNVFNNTTQYSQRILIK